MRPTDVNGINKAAGEYYHLVYNNVFNVRACSLRLTNVYGPRQLIRHSRQGFIGWFIRPSIEDGTIQIYGDGSQLRDFVYVDDAADAFLRAGASDACNGEVFNVGGDEPLSHRELSTLLVEIAGTGRVEYVAWPPDKKAIDIGDFYADSSKFKRTTGWTPTIVDSRRVSPRRSPSTGSISTATSGQRRRADRRDAARAFLSAVPRRARTPRPCARRSTASSRAAGSSSARRWPRSRRSSRRRPAPRTPWASAPAPTRSR